VTWEQVPLGHCVSEVRHKNLGGREQNLLSLSYGRIVRRDINSNEGLLPESFDTYNVVQPGDTVLRLTDLQNDQRSLRVGLVQEQGIITSAYVSIRPGREVDATYLNYFLKHLDFCKEFYSLGAGVRQSLKFDELKGVRVPVPQIATQRAIADYLDAETARIDALILKKQRMIASLGEQLDSLMVDLLGASDQKEARLGQVLDRIIDYRGATPEKTDHGVPLLTASNITGGRIDLEASPQFVSESTYQDWMRRGWPKVGDIVFTTEAPLGEVALLTDARVALAQRLMLFRPRSDLITAEYLYIYLLSSIGRSEVGRRASGSTVMGIRTDRLREVLVRFPGLSEQAKVVSRIRYAQQRQKDLKSRLERQIELIREHRQALITAAVTGELTTREVAG
jgi:type I restriction enzyme S subunit